MNEAADADAFVGHDELATTPIWTLEWSPDVPPLPALPNAATSFVSRPGLISSLLDLVLSRRLVSVVGIGGIGKTRVALEAASALVDRKIRAGFVSLADVSDPNSVADEIGAQLGVVVMPEAALFDGIVQRLSEAPSVLVIDNFEHLLDARQTIATLLTRCTDLRVIVTTRVPLGIEGETTFVVPPLDAGAADLFLARSGSDARHDREVVLATEVGRRLGGIPLAIELAAARAQVLGTPAVLEILSSDSVFEGLGDRTEAGPDRHRSLRRCLEWSYRDLDDAGKRVLAAVGVCMGPFGIGAIRSMVGDPAVAVSGLTELVQHRLVERVPSDLEARFSVNPVIREFARDLDVSTPDGDAMTAAHARWFASSARQIRQAFDDASADAVSALRRDGTNINAAIARLLASGKLAAAAEIAADVAAVRGEIGYESAVYEWFRHLGKVAEAAAVDLPLEAALWSAFADVMDRSASVPGAYAALAALVDQARSEHDEVALLVGLDLIVKSLMAHGDAPAAMRGVEEGLALAETRGVRRSVAQFAYWRSVLAYLGGDAADAFVKCRRSLAIAREVGDKILIVRSGLMLTIIEAHSGGDGQPVPSFESLLTLARASGSVFDELMVLLQMANRDAIRRDRNVFTVALEGMRLAQRTCSHAREACAVFALATAAFTFSDDDVAARLHAAMLGEWQSIVVSVPPDALGRYQRFAEECRGRNPTRFDEAVRSGAPADWVQVRRIATDYARARAAVVPSDPTVSPLLATLTVREREVLDALARGLTNKEIARTLGVSAKTVMHHCGSIFRKLDVRTRSEATRFAIQHGLGRSD